MAQVLAGCSCTIMFPLSFGTMDVNIGSKITRNRRELRDWSIESTFRVVCLSIE